MFTLPPIDDIVAAALAEDLGVMPARFSAATPNSAEVLDRDVTTSAVLSPGATVSGIVVAREKLVVAGLPVAARTWELLSETAGLDGAVEVFPLVAEGASVDVGTPVAEVEGNAAVVLTGERTALNFLMVLSGIATETARWQRQVGDSVAIVDTRKTYPGLRLLSKYAVSVGGGTNHRAGLWDMALLKDNHLAATSIADAVTAVRSARPELPIQVEADTTEQALEATRAGADMVLLDNMDTKTLTATVAAVRASAPEGAGPVLEASGGVTFELLPEIAATGVDRVSSSAITFARPVDLALDLGRSA